jgi:Flp pilus assembly protein CpaB
MRPSVIMLAVIAFVLAGAAAFLVKVFLEKQAQPVIVQEDKPKGVAKVLVASRTINPGEILSAKDVTWADWPKSLVEERMINENEFVVPSATMPPTQVGLVVRTDEASPAPEASPTKKKKDKTADGETGQSAKSGSAETAIIGAVARRRIIANEPISPDQLIQRGDRSIGAAVVSPGMRAVSIGISAASASGGFIAPGDYVDVMLSIEFKTATDENGNKLPEGAALMLPDGDSLVKVSTETVLRNVRVLAIDQSLGRSAEDGPADVGKTATLEVSLADTEKLLTAARLGSLALVLRSMVVEDSPQDEVDAFEDPFNFTTDVATSRAVSALHTTSSLYGYRGGESVRVNRGGAISQEGY